MHLFCTGRAPLLLLEILEILGVYVNLLCRSLAPQVI